MLCNRCSSLGNSKSFEVSQQHLVGGFRKIKTRNSDTLDYQNQNTVTSQTIMGREEGGEFRMGNTCIPVVDSFQYLAKPIQYCKV